MNESTPIRASTALLFAGAAVATIYVAAQIFQRWVFVAALPEAPDLAAEMARRLLPVERARQAAVLLSLALAPVAYAALATARFRVAPGASFAGLVFGALFSGFETAYRSIELFAGGRWAEAWLAGGDALERAALAGRFTIFEEAVTALYFPLLLAHGIASAAFAAALRGACRPLDRALALALAANSVRALLRMLQTHAGIAALGEANRALYLPVTLATYGLLAAWLARAAFAELAARRAPTARQAAQEGPSVRSA